MFGGRVPGGGVLGVAGDNATETALTSVAIMEFCVTVRNPQSCSFVRELVTAQKRLFLLMVVFEGI